MFDFVKKLMGKGNDVELKKLEKTVDAVMALEGEYQKLTDEQLKAKTQEFKDRLAKGETEDDILVEAFATIREADWRVLGMRPYRVQVIGGLVLHQGRIAEMKTGEGKTLVATLPSYLNALSGKGVHVVTVNDYLARRDSEWMGKVHRFLGLTVGLVLTDMEPEQRRAAYACDITYGTNNELGFDYLRDNMARSPRRLTQRGYHYALIDEVDSILIDEARTPLIISGIGEQSNDLYKKANDIVIRLKPDVHYTVDEKKKTVVLTDEGAQRVETFFGIENINDAENAEINHHVHCALRANALMKRDVDYVVQQGKVIIVDSNTGRLMVGRRYSDGLHQAIEAKENVTVERENQTLATITLQNYFRMYDKLAGMTGTAKTEEDEFRNVYGMDVVEIPSNLPNKREDKNDALFLTEDDKFSGVVTDIIEHHKKGQPVLVGTVTVEKSEKLSALLAREGIEHEVLNAKHHAREADIVAQAGKYGAVTIATNMAGRGTDILLGGNPEYMARHELRVKGYEDDVIEAAVSHSEDVSDEIRAVRAEYRSLYDGFKKETDAEHEKVLKVGGLHIIGTERHESRRIDNQLRGRAGRQGDPGSSQFYISFSDDLLRLFGSDKMSGLIAMVKRMSEDDRQKKLEKGKSGANDLLRSQFGIISREIEHSQKRIESMHAEVRRNTLEYDNVMNRQREVIYAQRRRVLMGENIRENIIGMADKLIDAAVSRYCGGDDHTEWNVEQFTLTLETLCVKKGYLAEHKKLIENEDKEQLAEALKEHAHAFYQERETELPEMFLKAVNQEIDMRTLERSALLDAVDRRWMDHIDAMSDLRDGIGFRAAGGSKPITEYQIEAGHMFEELNYLIREDTVRSLFQLHPKEPTKPKSEFKITSTSAGGTQTRQPVVRTEKKIGRNEKCPCGSGRKYKDCCGRRGQN